VDLTHPGRLAALGALAVPIVLHLWRRHRGRVIRVGSIRHLDGTSAVRRFSVRVAERWLLMVRLLVVAALVVAIAEPRIDLPARPGNVALIDPGAGEPGDALIDSLTASGDEVIRPAAGDLWSLAHEADARLSAGSRITLVTTPFTPLLGARPGLSSLTVARFIADSGTPDSMHANRRAPHHFDIIAPAPRQELARYFSAAIRATAEVRDDSVTIGLAERAGTIGSSTSNQTVFILDSVADPRSVGQAAAGATVVYFDDRSGSMDERPLGRLPSSSVRLFARTAGAVNLVRVSGTGPLHTFVLSDRLPALVVAIQDGGLAPAETRVRHTEQQLLPRTTGRGDRRQSSAPATRLFVAVAAALFGLERLLAHRRHPA